MKRAEYYKKKGDNGCPARDAIYSPLDMEDGNHVVARDEEVELCTSVMITFHPFWYTYIKDCRKATERYGNSTTEDVVRVHITNKTNKAMFRY